MQLSTSDKLGELLFDVFTDKADDKEMLALAVILHEFKTKAWRSYADVKKMTFARNIIDSLEEAVDFTEVHASDEWREYTTGAREKLNAELNAQAAYGG